MSQGWCAGSRNACRKSLPVPNSGHRQPDILVARLPWLFPTLNRTTQFKRSCKMKRIACAAVMALFVPNVLSADVFQFSTPSRNIECSVGLGETSADIMCTIHERSGPPAMPQPMSCAGPWGHHFTLLERGPVQLVCGAPGPKNTAAYVEIAPYGETGQFGAITCLSQKTGLECRNADGHGFLLSRATQYVF